MLLDISTTKVQIISGPVPLQSNECERSSEPLPVVTLIGDG